MSEDVVMPASLLDAPEGVSLDQYGKIEALLAIETETPMRELLARFDIDEERWSIAKKIWAKRINDEVKNAAQPGQSSSAEARYPLSMRYAAVYAEEAESAREQKARAPSLPERSS